MKIIKIFYFISLFFYLLTTSFSLFSDVAVNSAIDVDVNGRIKNHVIAILMSDSQGQGQVNDNNIIEYFFVKHFQILR